MKRRMIDRRILERIYVLIFRYKCGINLVEQENINKFVFKILYFDDSIADYFYLIDDPIRGYMIRDIY